MEDVAGGRCRVTMHGMDVQGVHLQEYLAMVRVWSLESSPPTRQPCNWPRATSARRKRHLFLIPTKEPYELTMSLGELDFELNACEVFVI